MITCVGDCGVDRYLDLGRDRPGGITLNFAVNMRRACPPSDRVCVVTALGTDPEARLVRRAIEALGIESCLVELAGATSIQYIDRQPSGEKLFVRYEEGVLGPYRVGPSERELIARSDLLMAVAYSQIEGLFDSVMASPSPGLRAVDFGDLDFSGGLDFVERHLEHFHVGFFGLTSADQDLIAGLERIARRSGRLLVVTLGADGSLGFEDGARIPCPAVPVPRVVDTTGAGDAFAAGFLSEYCRSRRARQSLAAGAESAAQAVQQLGAFPWEAPPVAP
jgi:fructoselysine 6-kinase